MTSFPRIYPFSRKLNDAASFKIMPSALLVLATGLMLLTRPAQAVNLLVNPGFEQSSGRAVPVNWTRFAPPTAQNPPNLWVEGTQAIPQAGLEYFKEWNACYNTT